MSAPWGELGVPGHINTGAEWEAFLDAVGDPPRAQLRANATQSIANSGPFVGVTWHASIVDSHVGWSATTTPSRYVCRVAGTYLLLGKVGWAANATGQRASQWLVNGTAVDSSQVGHPAVAAVERQFPAASMLVELSVNDFVELGVFQDSGGSLNLSATNAQVSSFMTIRWWCL